MTPPVRVLDYAFNVRDLPSLPRLLLINMAKLGNNTAQCFASQRRLAAMCGCSIRTVRRSQLYLRDKNYIYRAPNPKRSTDLYILNFRKWDQSGQLVRRMRPQSPPACGQDSRQNLSKNPNMNRSGEAALRTSRRGKQLAAQDALVIALAKVEKAIDDRERSDGLISDH